MSQSCRNQGFSNYFCLVIEGSGSGAGFGSKPLTNGSDPDPGGPKTYGSNGSRSGLGSATLLSRNSLRRKYMLDYLLFATFSLEWSTPGCVGWRGKAGH
jgi:hypothetical protein